MVGTDKERKMPNSAEKRLKKKKKDQGSYQNFAYPSRPQRSTPSLSPPPRIERGQGLLLVAVPEFPSRQLISYRRSIALSAPPPKKCIVHKCMIGHAQLNEPWLNVGRLLARAKSRNETDKRPPLQETPPAEELVEGDIETPPSWLFVFLRFSFLHCLSHVHTSSWWSSFFFLFCLGSWLGWVW